MIRQKLTQLLLFAVAVAGMEAGAQAQLESSRSGSSTLQYLGQAESMATLAFWGRCYAKRQRAASLMLLGTRPSSIEEANVYRKLFSRDGVDCLSGETLSAPLSYVRGAVAEGLLVAGQGVPPEYLQPATRADGVRNLSDAARCFVADHGDQARSVLATKPGSKQEYAALVPLLPNFSACLPAGVKPNFDATVIRFRLAEALLRIAPQAPATTSGSSD